MKVRGRLPISSVAAAASPSVIVAACVADKDDFRERRWIAFWSITPARRRISSGQNIDTHDDRHRHCYQPRRRPCCLRQAVAAAAVEAQTTLELPTRVTQCREANPRHAQLLVLYREAMRLDQHAERVLRLDRMHSTNNLHEADAARSQAATKPRAAGSNDTTRYVRPKHKSTDGVQLSDRPFSVIARNSPQTRARRCNCQWNYCRSGQTSSTLAGFDADCNMYGYVPRVRTDAAGDAK